MNYKETLEYIHNTPKFSRVLGNDLLRKLLDKLGNPQNGLKFIHIAGTNGKGSCAVMLSEILVRAGYTTGLYTSPYIEKFNERIRVNGTVIENRKLSAITTKIRRIIEENDTPVSEFALDTAIAFEYFKEKKCDIVVLETGLGGRLDATNVINESVVSVLMSIGLDHTQYLGDTIEQITAEKCGILKENGDTVVYPIQEEKCFEVIKEFCEKLNNKLTITKMPEISEGNKFDYDGKKYELGLSGEFQKYNGATVLETVKILKNKGFDISDEAVSKGLKSAFNPGRLEKLPCGIIIDGAHNLPAISALCESLKQTGKAVRLCVAMMEDKDISGCIDKLSEIAESVIVTQIDMPRCASVLDLKEKFESNGIKVQAVENPANAVKKLIKITGEDEIACACGSLYFIGEIRKKFAKPMKKYYVYMLRCLDNSLYTGITTDVERRFREHTTKDVKGAKYTKARMPVSIEAVWEREGRSDASKLEAELKALTKAEKEKLIKENPYTERNTRS